MTPPDPDRAAPDRRGPQAGGAPSPPEVPGPTEVEAFLAGLVADVPSSAVFLTPEGVLVQFLIPWDAVTDARTPPGGPEPAPQNQGQGFIGGD